MKCRVYSLLLAVLSVSCSKLETTISALCEKDLKGNYTIKWEVFPEEDDAIIEIYASENDSVFPLNPVKRLSANKFIAVIENADSLGYSYFKLKVGDTFSNVITNRFYELDEVFNFRDLGGYETANGERIKWSKIYRAGEFSKLTEDDSIKLGKLKIKSIIDLRSEESQRKREDKLKTPNRFELYVESSTSESVKEEVVWDRFLRGDAIIYMQDTYEHMFLRRSEEYAKLFDLLSDEANYPLVFHCSWGKDETGVAAYFLLRALGVTSELAEDDYRLSNIGIDKTKTVAGVSEMTESQQEAFTMLIRTDVSYLRYGLACVRKDEGSIEDYMTYSLGLTKEKRRKLRSILLY